MDDETLINSLTEETLSSYVPPELRGKVPRAIRVLRSTWTSSDLFLGSYSYMHKRSSAEDIDTLGRPVSGIGECMRV